MAEQPAPDLDLRLVRYFTVVAGHRHFGRAAEELHIAQPSLSRQIRRLEEQVGARLFDRTPQGSRLTDAGEVFLPRAQALLRSAVQATALTRAAAEPPRLTVGYATSLIVTPAVREVRRLYPEADVRAVHLEWREVHEALRSHRVEVVVARLPFRTEGLDVTVLYAEPRVVLVPLDHRLAGKESVGIEDIADEPIPRVRSSDPEWSAYWRIDPRPDGRPAPDGPLIDAMEDKFEVIAAGEAIAIAASNRAYVLRPDITAVPLRGVAPSEVAVATRAGETAPLVAAFRRAAATLLKSQASTSG